MGAFLAATVYAWVSHTLAWVLLPRSVAWGIGARALVLWTIAAAALFFFRDPMTTMLMAGCAMLLLAPLSLAHRAAFFLIAAPCVPVYLFAPLPFPGINHLTVLTHYKIAVVTVLLPLLFYSRSKYKISKRSSVAGICLLLYVGYTTTIAIGFSNSTSGLRFLVDQLLSLAIPFFALRFALQTLDDVDICLEALLVATVFLGAAALVASAKQWDFYSLLQPASVFSIPDLRSGFVRINASVNTHSLGFHCAAGLVTLQYLKARLGIGWLSLNILRIVLLTGIYFTDSRGAMGGLAVAAIVYTIIAAESRRWRLILAALVPLGGVAILIWLLTGEFGSDGPMGSFTYRQELLRTAIPHIVAHPLFGDYTFYRDRAFQHLIQGQGIIDITNLYLQVALHYGLMGLTLFFMVVLAPLFVLTGRALRRAERAPAREAKNTEENAVSPEWRRAAGVVVGILSGWLFLVATTSDVGLTVHIGVVFAAMAQGLCDLSKARVVGPSAKAWATAQLAPSNLPARGSVSSRTSLLVERPGP